MPTIEFSEKIISNLGKGYHILIPTVKLDKTYVLKVDREDFILLGNKLDLQSLANIFQISSVLKNSIIYIPTGINTPTTYLLERWGQDNPSDLVILHHLLHFNIKNWKHIRNLIRKRKGETICYRTEETKLNRANGVDFYYKENKDILHLKNNYNTLFMEGSSNVFDHIAGDCLYVANNGEELYRQFPGFHEHEHLDMYLRDKTGMRQNMTIDYYDQELWDE